MQKCFHSYQQDPDVQGLMAELLRRTLNPMESEDLPDVAAWDLKRAKELEERIWSPQQREALDYIRRGTGLTQEREPSILMKTAYRKVQ